MRAQAEIRAELARQRLTITELAERTGIPRGRLSARLNDENSSLTLTELYAISTALGCRPSELIARAEAAQLQAV